MGTYGVSAELAAARLAAALGPCSHENTEAVETLGLGLVAWLCEDCGTQLPKDWE